MGTPGDEKKVEKVVKTEPLDPTEQSIEDAPQANVPSPSQPQPPSPPPTALPIEEMGYLKPKLLLSDLDQSTAGAILEQAHLDDYYTQTKFYPAIQEPTKITYGADETAGPSGLQRTNVRSKKRTKQPRSTDQPPPKKPFTCQACNKSYANIEKLNKHQQTHSAASPFKCDNCKKSFSSKFKLVRHALIHSDRKPFSCTVCERTFHRKDHLKNHIKVHSPTKKVYTCEKENCKKEYTSLLSYKKHLALHAAQEGSLECQICSNSFRTKEDILFHLKIHAGSRTVKDPNEKKYRCEHCDRKFFTKKDVRRHLVVHTGMRDFLCQFCPQRFGRKDHLGRHIKKSHSKDMRPEDLDPPATVKIETIVKSEQEDFYTPTTTPTLPSGEGTSDYDVKSETVTPTPFAQTGLTATDDILDYCLDVRQFFPETEMENFLDDTVENDLSLMLSPPCQSDFIQILEDINPSTSSSTLPETDVSDNSGLLTETEVLSNPEIQRLLLPSEEINLPLPGFQQTFQSPPPPQPPPPPP